MPMLVSVLEYETKLPNSVYETNVTLTSKPEKEQLFKFTAKMWGWVIKKYVNIIHSYT